MGHETHDDGANAGSAFVEVLGRVVANDLLQLAEGYRLRLLTSSAGRVAAYDAVEHFRFVSDAHCCTVLRATADDVTVLINELSRLAAHVLAPRVGKDDQNRLNAARRLLSDCTTLADLLPRLTV